MKSFAIALDIILTILGIVVTVFLTCLSFDPSQTQDAQLLAAHLTIASAACTITGVVNLVALDTD